MARNNGKSIRFDKLLEESGKPELATLWGEPEKDPPFMRAVKENRVVTVCQQNVGMKKDYGLAGFFKEKNASFLIFPKKISLGPETKIIGIKYDKIAESKAWGALLKRSKPRGPSARGKQTPVSKSTRKPEPKEKKPGHFKATLIIKAEQSVPLEVEAHSLKEAKKLLTLEANKVQIDPASAQISKKIGRVTLLGNQHRLHD